MTFQILPEIAAQVAAQSARLERHLGQIPATLLHPYWSLSRGLFHGWSGELEDFARRLPLLPAAEFAPAWDRARETIEVSFLTEMLTRVWGTVLLNAGAQRGDHRLDQIVRSVALAMRETRCHALQLLLSEELADRVDQAGLDRFRRRTERWTDLMLAPVVDLGGNASLAFVERRVRAFASDYRHTRHDRPGEAAWKLLLAGFRLALPPQTYQYIDRAPLMALVQSVLSCFPEEQVPREETTLPTPSIKSGSAKLPPLRPPAGQPAPTRNIYLPPGQE